MGETANAAFQVGDDILFRIKFHIEDYGLHMSEQIDKVGVLKYIFFLNMISFILRFYLIYLISSFFHFLCSVHWLRGKCKRFNLVLCHCFAGTSFLSFVSPFFLLSSLFSSLSLTFFPSRPCITVLGLPS